MPFPGTVPTTTITKDYRDAQGNFPEVRVSFTPSQRKVITAAGLTIEPVPVIVIPVAGQLSVVLARTDGFSYRISELVDGKQRAPFDVLVPGVGPYKLDELAPVEPEFDDYIPVRTVEGLGPDANGNIDLPPSAGSDPAGTAAGLVAAHEAAANPHPVYLTQAEADAIYPTSVAVTAALGTKENAGVAAGLITAHEGAANPHPVYLTQAEADALYAAIGDLPTKQTKLICRQSWLTAGNINLNVSAGGAVWELLPGSPSLVLPAAVGDTIGLDASIGRQANANLLMDIGVVTTGPTTIRRWLGNGAVATPAGSYEGDTGLYHTNIPVRTGGRRWVVTADEIQGGNVTFQILRKVNGAGSALVLMDAVNPGYWQATNYGVVT